MIKKYKIEKKEEIIVASAPVDGFIYNCPTDPPCHFWGCFVIVPEAGLICPVCKQTVTQSPYGCKTGPN